MKNNVNDSFKNKNDFLYSEEINDDSINIDNSENISDDNLNNSVLQKDNKKYRFLLLGSESEGLFVIKASYKNFEENIKRNTITYDNENQINIELSPIEQNEIDKSILFDGIIFIYNLQGNKVLGNTIEKMIKIDKAFKKIYPNIFFPKVILGNISDVLTYINKKYFKKENIIKKRSIFLIKDSSINQIGISYAVNHLIKMHQINKNYKNYIHQNKINEKEFINSLNKNKINLLKCLKCNQILEISLDKISKSIYLYCNKCNIEKKCSFLEFRNIRQEYLINCNECKKIIYESNLINYCYKCKKYICNECLKAHLNKESKEMDDINYKNIIYPYNLIDNICNLHDKIRYNYCINCKKKICPYCEMESHINHKTKVFDEKEILGLLNIQKENLKLEKEEYSKMKKFIQDCFKSLKEYFYNLLLLKEKEINIKEEIIRELEIFKYDNTLFKNIKNLYFENYDLIYNYQESWDKKLNYILKIFNEPIKIKKNNLCKKENLKGPYNIIQKASIENSLYNNKNDEIVTDLCSLGNYAEKNYFAISFNTGQLKIYNDNFENRIPVTIIKEFEPYEGINSLYRTIGNNVLLVGNSQIKKIYLSEDFKEYRIINEIEVSEQLFKKVLELDSLNALITSNNYNQLIIYDSTNGKQLSEIMGADNNREIIFLDKISENKIILKISEIDLFDSINVDLGNKTISNDEPNNIYNDDENLFENETVKISNRIYYQNDNKESDITWKIFEFEMKGNEIKIKKDYIFDKNIIFLGKINDKLLLLFCKNDNKIVLFDYISYINCLKLSFNSPIKPIISFPLSNKIELLDFLILNEERYLIQCGLNIKMGFLYVINKIKVAHSPLKNNKDNQNISNDENELINEVVKIISLKKNNFILITKDKSIYNLKN